MAPAPPAPPARSRVRRRLDRFLTLVALAGVVVFHHWTVDSSHGFVLVAEDDLYHLLVRGFRQGQLHLDRAPPAELLALADPYDPAQNAAFRLPDASYHRGHFYLYFGVTPVVTLLLPYALITGHDLSTGAAVFVFTVAGFLAASAFWLALRRRYFPASAVGTGALGVAALGMGTHLLALTRRPMVWELPIAAAFAFGMLALVAVSRALHGRHPHVWLGAAGLSLGLAMAARPPWLFGCLLLIPPWWLLVARSTEPRRTAWRAGLAAVAGAVLCGLALLAYNHARFGSPLEFGQNLQLTSAHEQTNRHFGLDYLTQNLPVYLLHPVQWSWDFPYIHATTPGWSLPGYAGSEEMAGLLVTFPFLVLAAAAPFAGHGRPPGEAGVLRALLGAVALLFLGLAGFLLTFFSTTERYLAEFTPALALLALAGWLELERRSRRHRWGVAGRASLALLVAASVPMGVLLSLNYHGNAFSRDHPELWSRLAENSQRALAEIGRLTGAFSGPAVLDVRFESRPPGTVETVWRSAGTPPVEQIRIERLDGNAMRFGFIRDGGATHWGDPIVGIPDARHRVELQVPSLYGPAEGWMRGLRRAVEFQERSSVAVRFDGRQVLSALVDPLDPKLPPGGRVGEDFGGRIEPRETRLFRATDILPARNPPITTPPGEPAGGTLRLRVRFAFELDPRGEPLFAAGDLYGSDLVLVREAANGALQLCFEHFGSPLQLTPPLALDRRQEHVLEIRLPTFARGKLGERAAGEILVRVNGATALREPTDTHGFPADSARIGRNPFGTTCGPDFRGWIVDAAWSDPGAAPE
jgi:hypothetical protein